MRSGSELSGDGEHGEPTPERRMSVDQRLALVQTGLAWYGEGFLAWLTSGRADYADPALLEEFTYAYAGWYPDRRSFVSRQLDSFDWAAATDTFLADHGLPPGALHIDEDSVFAHCCELYAVEERLGGVHVFTR